MSWNIANAKQQFSELVRLSAEGPQFVFNRSRRVAVVLSAEAYGAYETWKGQSGSGPADVGSLFAEARAALAECAADGLEIPPRRNRPDPMLIDEGGPADATG